jgi:uncharacterized lipoprotein YajG
MKKLLLVIASLTVLLMTGCNKEENVVDYNEDVSQNTQQNEVVNNDVSTPIEENTTKSDSYFDTLVTTKWQIRHLKDSNGEEIELDEHYGKGIHQYGYGELQFNSDNTFVEIYPGVSEGNGEGTYSYDNQQLVLKYNNNYTRTGMIKIENGIKQLELKDDDYTYYFNDIEYKYDA